MILIVLALCLLSGVDAKKNKVIQTKVVEGYVTHGVNNFNQEMLHTHEFTEDPFTDGHVNEVACWNPDGDKPIKIDASTNRDTCILAPYIDDVADYFGVEVIPELYNKAFNDFGTLTPMSHNWLDRQVLPFFGLEGTREERMAHPSWDRRHSKSDYTLREFERASGRVTVNCLEDGGADVAVSMRGGFPLFLYTLWIVGGANDHTPNLAPFMMGMAYPNVVISDENGNLDHTFQANFCPLGECGPGLTCTWYLSLLAHFDGCEYGGSPALIYFTPPGDAAVSAANHIYFPMQGDILLPPHNAFHNGKGKGNAQF